jgi:hypothetical protein
MAGVVERGIGAKGYPGTWEISTLPAEVFFQSVLRSQGTTEVKRDERREVVAARSTDEAGIAAQATLQREGTAWLRNREKERWQGYLPLRTSQRNFYG